MHVSKLKAVTSESELQLRIDCTIDFPEDLRKIIVEGKIREGEFDEIHIGPDSDLFFRLFDKPRAHSTADSSGFALKKARTRGGLQHRFDTRAPRR